MVIRLEDVSRVLQETFGPEIDPERRIAEPLAQILRGWVPVQVPLDALSEALQNALMGGLVQRLGEALLIPDGRRWRRVRTRDLERCADGLLGLAFDALGNRQTYYELVRDWAFGAGSMAALDCLCRRFSDFQSPGDQALFRQFLENRRREEGL